MSKFLPVPPGPWPAGQAWYPLLGTWGPVGSFDMPDDLPDDLFLEVELPLHCWRTREGNVVRICDLETSHLRNILRMIERANGGPGCLVKLQETNGRVRNLANEWLKRF